MEALRNRKREARWPERRGRSPADPPNGDLIAEIKQTWSDGGRNVGTESDILAKYRKAKYLVLDEFHERGASDWEQRTINNILDHRYDAMLVTVIIANLSRQDFQTQISPSIRSRAEETGGLIVCDWPSYRKAA